MKGLKVKRKRAKEELQEIKDYYRQLFEDAPISFWMEDHSAVKKHIDNLRDKGVKDFGEYFLNHPEEVTHCATLVKIVDVNKATLKLYKAKSKEEIQEGLCKVFSEESYDMFREELIGVAESKTWFEGETINQTLAGDKIHIFLRWSVVPGYEQTLSRILVSIIDITERKRAEEALRESKKFTENLIASMQDGFSVLDNRGVHIDVNHALCRMTGFSREELIGVGPPHPYWPPEAYEEIESAFQKTLWGEFRDFELTFMRKNGEHFPVIVRPSWIKDKQGNVISYFATVKDITDRKRAEEMVRKSKQLLEKIFASLLDAIFIIDADTVEIMDCNQAASEMFGYSRQEMLGRTTTFLHIDEAALEEFRKHLYAAIKERGFLEKLEFRMKRKDGTIFSTEHTVTPLEDDQGHRIGWVSVVRDITERKKSEEALRKSEERFSKAFHANPALITITRLDDGRLIDANDAFLRMVGFAREEAIGRTSLDLGVWENPDDRQRMVQMLAQRKALYNLDYKFRTKSGEIRDLITSLELIEIGGEPCILGLTLDITERKRAEEALRDSEERYRKLFENAMDGIALADAETGILLDCNKAIERLVGREKSELIRQSQKILHPPEDSIGEVSRTFALHRSDKEGQVLETQVITKTGERKQVEIKANILELKGRKAIQGIFRDVTERKQAEDLLKSSHEQLRALSAHLQSLREEERTLIAREIHDELGQALTGLKIDLSWVSRRLSQDQKALIEKMDSMSRLIDTTVQTVRRISSELRPGILDDLGLTAAIEWLAQDFQNRTGIQCEFHSDTEDIDLDRDRSSAIFRIVQEALMNVVRHANATHVNIHLRGEEDTLSLEVKDNGIGITESEIYGLKSLGLLGMRERAHVFGGDVEIKGKHNEGTTVTVKIPLKT